MKKLLLVILLFTSFSAIARDPAQVREFRKDNPCPSTGKTKGACPGYVVDHKYPICAGGEDVPDNMEWEGKEPSMAKDRIERELCALKKSCISSPL